MLFSAAEQQALSVCPGCRSVAGKKLIHRVAAAFLRSGHSLGFAESLTAGLAAAMLAEVPGVSSFFRGGVVAYQNETKQRLLGVHASTLKQEGAVSAACVREMAEGLQERLRLDYAVSLSGLAGPGGGSLEIPVGTVFLGLATGWAGEDTESFSICFQGDREMVRERAVYAAYAALERLLQHA